MRHAVIVLLGMVACAPAAAPSFELAFVAVCHGGNARECPADVPITVAVAERSRCWLDAAAEEVRFDVLGCDTTGAACYRIVGLGRLSDGLTSATLVRADATSGTALETARTRLVDAATRTVVVEFGTEPTDTHAGAHGLPGDPLGVLTMRGCSADPPSGPRDY